MMYLYILSVIFNTIISIFSTTGVYRILLTLLGLVGVPISLMYIWIIMWYIAIK